MDWPRQHKLSPNVVKCEYMFLGNNKQFSRISEIGDIELTKMKLKG